MEDVLNYLNMGGYAAFVWGAYGLSALGLGGVFVMTLRTLKARQKEFDALKSQRREG
jgi:heme exporter protein CcmD